MQAIYSTGLVHGKSFVCRIPKRDGSGFLKSAMGHNHTNEAGRKWIDHHPVIASGDYCDLDGYLDIDLTINKWEPGYKEGIEEVKTRLIEIFPHITVWRKAALVEIFQ